MILTRNEILEKFSAPVFVPHPVFKGHESFPSLTTWPQKPIAIELPTLHIELNAIDYVRKTGPGTGTPDAGLRFQQDTFRLWYQIDGQGILHNASLNVSGTARPGLLGIMGRGERHTYLHQKGDFECFCMLFTIKPANQLKCCWSSTVSGKKVLLNNEKLVFENHVFEMLYAIAGIHDTTGVLAATHCMELILQLFLTGIITVEMDQFPKDKNKFLVHKAREYMDINYASMHTQTRLAAECGVNINYLNVLFKANTKQTLYDYLIKVRMEHAKHLLEEGVLSITDIAAKVGYPNSNSFARIFKGVLKKSPTEYKEQILQSISKRSH